MANEDENLESMNNGDLAMEFLKRCQKCRETGVPNDMAILAALHDLADWKDAHPSEGLVSVDAVYMYLVERCFFTEAEAKEVLEGLKEPDYNKIAMYDCHTCANYQTKCDPEHGIFECKNPPFTSMYDNEKLPFPRVNEFEVGASYRR